MTEAKRARRPAGSGYARGDETRLRIIEAAIERFGEAGFDGASTRDIAARAGVNAPALQYYFQSKEGLYRACAEHIAEDVRRTFDPAIERARQQLQADHAPADALIDAFTGIQDAMAERMFNPCGGPDLRLFFAREQAGHEPPIASDILQERVRKPLNEVCTALVARICGTAANDPRTVVRVFTLHGQLLIFNTIKRGALSLLGWQNVDASRAELIKETVREQTRTLLRMWAGAQGGGSARRGAGVAVKRAPRPRQ
ncbi:CerR family C-terminal domain-containing protein [Bordetella genomosp. 9]|uniref:TetR family transcriptional regulator n=1 Tax=Bordetella genomosp. 9 TaxID=1416803 RepID=A0A1W6Z0C2_9BORD|nr:CerR family C-terminal domain-containing protein [Bordetella genomosp. 9]ARP86758.1 TetR family transcriptional regulator [Bordetella genomosp. 9]